MRLRKKAKLFDSLTTRSRKDKFSSLSLYTYKKMIRKLAPINSRKGKKIIKSSGGKTDKRQIT